MGGCSSAPRQQEDEVQEFVPQLPQARFVKGTKCFKRVAKVENKASWDILFLELVESERELAPGSLTKLWDRYDPSGQGFIGKPQLKKFLLDFVSVLQRNYLDAVDEDHLFHFRETADERAFRAKQYLDVRKRGRVTFGDFKRINDVGFWDQCSHEQLIDERLEGIRMWRKIFDHMNETGILSENYTDLIWERYETEEKEFITAKELQRLLGDWIEACYVHYQGNMKELDLISFQQSISVRADLAHKVLDTNSDGLVDFEEFTAIGNKKFWETIDVTVNVIDVVTALSKKEQEAREINLLNEPPSP